MENQDTNKSLFDLSFDENSKQQLKGAATWGGYAAIISIAGSVLSLVNYFIQRSRVRSYQFEGFPEMRTTSGSGNIISAFISFIVAIALFYFLYKFSKTTKAGIDGSNQPLISEGLGSLSSYFKIIGVLLILAIVFGGLGLMIALGSSA